MREVSPDDEDHRTTSRDSSPSRRFSMDIDSPIVSPRATEQGAHRRTHLWEPRGAMSSALEVQANYHKMRADEGMLKDVPML